MKAKKLLVLGLCMTMIACISITATLAYFTDKTEVVNNTFTVGNIDIELDEAPVDEDGIEMEGTRVIENEYQLFPGSGYDKDPTVHVIANSEDCWLFAKVENGILAIEDDYSYVNEAGKTITLGTIHDQILANGWVLLETDAEGANYYAYTKIVNKATADQDVVLFTNFAITGENLVSLPLKTTITNEDGSTSEIDTVVPAGQTNLNEYLDAEINVTAYAIQATNLDTYTAAWAAYKGQHSAL